MKRIIALAMGMLLLAGCGVAAAEPGISHIEWDNHDLRAEQFVLALTNGDFTTAAEGFDEEMQRALSVRALGSNWRAMTRQAGALVAMEIAELEPHDAYDIYNVVTQHEKSKINTRIVFSADGLVAGLFFTFV